MEDLRRFVRDLKRDLDLIRQRVNNLETHEVPGGGAGSGLDADTVDGYDASDFALASHVHDASVITFTPAVAANWDGSADPGNVDNALDQLAERVTDVEGGSGSPVAFTDLTDVPSDYTNDGGKLLRVQDDELGIEFIELHAASVAYDPYVTEDWDATPDEVSGALDQLADRVRDIEGSPGGTPDASDVTYTPNTLGDWDSSTDPGNVDGALDQLASRVKDIEDTGGSFTYTRWDVDAPPTSPHAKDDEFNDNSFDTSKWTDWNYTGSTLYKDETPQGLYLRYDVSPNGYWAGIYQPLPYPVNDFTISTRVNTFRTDGPLIMAGLAVFENPTNAGGSVWLSEIFTHGFAGVARVCQLGNYSGIVYETGSDILRNFAYLRIRYSLTYHTLYFDLSADGLSWSMMYSEPLSFSVRAVGLTLRAEWDDSDRRGLFRFFRFKETMDSIYDPLYGRSVSF